MHTYAHCLPENEGGVTVVAINLDQAAAHSLKIPKPAERFSLASTGGLRSTTVELNGTPLQLVKIEEKQLPGRKGLKIPAGEVKLAPASITFLAIPGAGNENCRAE